MSPQGDSAKNKRLSIGFGDGFFVWFILNTLYLNTLITKNEYI